MANICSNFKTSLGKVLENYSFSDLFIIDNSGKIKENGEGLTSLSVDILSKTKEIIDKNVVIEDILIDSFSDENDGTAPENGLSDENLSDIKTLIVNKYNKIRKLQSFEVRDKEFPIIENNLANNFEGDNTLKLFSKWFDSLLIKKSIRSSYGINKNINDLNESIQELKQELIDNINNILENKNHFELYLDKGNGGKALNILPYNLTLLNAKDYFSDLLINNKYKSRGNVQQDLAYYSYFTLLNFDKLIDNINFSNIVGVTRQGLNFRKSNTIPNYNIAKYDYAFKQLPKQRWDEDLTKDNDAVNPLVKKYIDNIQMYSLENDGTYKELPNQYLSYNNFKQVLRILKYHDSTKNIYSQLRNNTFQTITDLFEKANSYRKVIFSGENYQARTYFDTMYHELFSKNIKSSLVSLYDKIDPSNLDFDIYGMILNQINKTSFATYTQYIYNPETKEIVTSVLDSSEINKKKFEIERKIMCTFLFDNTIKDLLTKWKVNFKDSNGNIFNYYEGEKPTNITKIEVDKGFSIDLSDINNPKYYFNNKPIVKGFLYNGDFVEILNNLFKDFVNISSDKNFINILNNILNSDEDLSSVLDVITSTLLGMNISSEVKFNPTPNIISNFYPGINLPNSISDSWKYINKELKTIKISGLFKSLKGLELLAKAQSIINGDVSKSNVTDANGNKLQKDRLTCLTNDDNQLFEQLKSKYSGSLGEKRIVDYNIFTSNSQNILKATELKTLFNSFYDQNPKKISKATDAEFNYLAFVQDFLTRDGEISVQPTVYSDKSTIWNKLIDLNVQLDMPWLPDNLKGKTLNKMSSEEVRQVKYLSTKYMADITLNQLLSDYKKLVSTGLFGKVNIDETDLITEYESYLKFFNENATQEKVEEALRYLKHTTGEMPLIIDQIHWLPGFKVNASLYEFLKMYYRDDTNKYNKLEEINKQFYALFLQNSRTKIDLSYNTGKTITEIKKGIESKVKQLGLNLDTFNKEWINSYTNELILFKAFKGKNEVSFFTEKDIIDETISIQLNPILDKFLSLDNLINTNYNILVYGLPFIHPAKKAAAKSINGNMFNFNFWDVLKEEGARTNASYKRAVIGGATIHTWLQKPTGINNELKLAIIEDPEDYVSNLHGEINKATNYDGSIWMSPFHAIWEKNSSEELKQSNIHRKPIGYYNLSNYLSSGLMKCATFSVSNAMILNSMGRAERILKKLSNENWIVPVDNIKLFHLKTKRKLNSSSIYTNEALSQSFNPRYKEVLNIDGKQQVVIKELIGLEYINSDITNGIINNYYKTTVKIIYPDKTTSTEEKEVNINSNYSLWKVLGGEKSIAYNGEYDESSIETVAKLANNISLFNKEQSIEKLEKLLTPEIRLAYSKFDKYIKDIKSSNTFLPLKISEISFLANHSAIKNGAVNLMSENNYNNDLDLLYTIVSPNFIGAQMSAEHEAENSEVSEMTQVISALIQRGVSYDVTLNIYNDIGTYIAEGLKPYMNTNNATLIKVLGKQLIKAFSSGDLSDESLASRYISLIQEDLISENVDKEILVPFEDPTIFNKFVIDFANNFNQEIIRRKFSGVNSVLVPSHDIIELIEHTDENGNTQLFTKSDYETHNGYDIITNIPNTEVDPGDVVFGDWVLDEGIPKKVTQIAAEDWQINLLKLREKYRAEGKKVTKINNRGRNLRGQNYKFNVAGKGKFDGYDLDSSKLSYSLESTLNKIESISDDGTLTTEFFNDLDVKRLNKLINFVKSKESLYTGKTEDCINNIRNAINGDKSAIKKLQLLIKEWLLSDCKHIQNKQFPSLIEWGEDISYIPIEGEIEYQANEMLLPRVWASKFMLTTNDNIGTILQNPVDFFKERIKNRYNYEEIFDNKLEGTFAALKGFKDSNNIYIGLKDTVNTAEFKRIDKPETIFIKNKKYIINDENEALFPYNPSKMEYYENEFGEKMILVENYEDILQLENQSMFTELVLLENKLDESILRKSKLLSKNILKQINDEIEDLEDLYVMSEEDINNKAVEIATSFKSAALNFIVARIPAQSMQSFMNMTIKGFINTDSNVVYVPIEQLVLQGSDYKLK